MSTKVEMVFWDVQHGHATYIKTPNDRHIVIDLGIGDYDTKDEKFSPLLHLRDKYGVKQLDYVVITHPHLDHIDDILNFDALNPKVLLRPKHITNAEVMENAKTAPAGTKEKFEKYCAINDRYNHPIDPNEYNNVHNPDNLGGMRIMSFVPNSCNHNNFNNHSIVTVIEYEGSKVVIPGDNEQCSFDELMKMSGFNEAVKDADILLAPHHGRESGWCNDFVTLVNPALTVVSDGRFCDTSANGRYSAKSRGWTVHKGGNGTSQERKCLTTNSDKEIYVAFGLDGAGKRFLEVRIK